MSSLSTQSEQLMVNRVIIVPLEGLIEHDPCFGDSFIFTSNRAQLVSD